jgi:hypothetical protein
MCSPGELDHDTVLDSVALADTLTALGLEAYVEPVSEAILTVFDDSVAVSQLNVLLAGAGVPPAGIVRVRGCVAEVGGWL